jgi:NAD(P)-dependent dehydrogenase (short-subunit alcohol dehydrogenase family)
MSLAIDLTGRTVLVTGASSGIGAHLARTVAAAGGAVALCARRADRLSDVCAEIEAAGGRAAAIAMDVADQDDTVAAFDQAEQIFGGVDSVIANAGMSKDSLAAGLPIADFSAVLDVNLKGAFLTAREGAKRMIAAGAREREHGRIVIISSITAFHVEGGLAAYSASKAGVLQMSKVLAREWARTGVNVNAICPGYIETELNSDWFTSEGGARQIAKWPRRRLMTAGDLDHITMFLLSDASRCVTGSAFTIDDGQTL